MNPIRYIVSRTIGLGIAILIISEELFACPVCYGDPESNITSSLFAGIFSLLGVAGVVFGGLAVFFYRMNERQKLNSKNSNLNNR